MLVKGIPSMRYARLFHLNVYWFRNIQTYNVSFINATTKA